MSACGEAESETELGLSLAHYQSQLSAVTDALRVRHAQDGGERAELDECRAALVELIDITEEKLLCVKKARLVSIYAGAGSDAPRPADIITLDSSGESENGDDPCTSTAALAHGEHATAAGNGTGGEGGGTLASAIGIHCRVPMCSAGLRYHNAIVYDLVPGDDGELMNGDIIDDVKVCVMFTRPLRTAMRPCEYFLSDRCKFGDNCRYSHGSVFKFSELLEEEDDQAEWQASVGDKCMVAPDEDGRGDRKLWRVGEVTCVDGDTAAVRLLETGDECECAVKRLQLLSPDAFLPAEQHHDCDTTSIVCVEDTAVSVPSLVDDCDEIRNERNASVYAVGELGSWEQHTKGIGSKLMSKMGYVRGRGLGKDKQGRLEPVQVTYCPKGKSLDKCMQLRQAVEGFAKHDGGAATERRDILKLLRNELRQKRAKEKRRAVKVKKQTLAESDDVFDFLNVTLGDKGRKAKGKSANQKQAELKKTSDKELNVKLLQADSRIASLEGDIVRHRDTFERMEGKDARTAAKLSSQMNEARAKIAAIHRKKYQLANEKSKRDSEKKLSVF